MPDGRGVVGDPADTPVELEALPEDTTAEDAHAEAALQERDGL